MDSSSHNLLAFSLCNHHSSHFPLFQSFTPTATTGGSVVDAAAPEDDAETGATDLSIFTDNGPKLEDFLGCSTTVTGAQLSQLCTETRMTQSADTELYDSDLKTIAASFLRGFSTEPKHTHKQQLLVPTTEITPKKTVDTFGQRTSIYRGVTRHRWTGRYEAHLWDNSCRREGQSRKGRQVYLGGYDKEDKAARAYDLAALKYWGPTTTTNFPVLNYEKELEEMKNMTRQEFVASLRRKSSGFSRGASIYRGVTRHHQHGRWQARIGRVAGNKDLYLGTFSTQEEAAEAYDIAAIKFRGLNAVTNFDMCRYDVKSIANSNLPIGGMSAKSKTSEAIRSDDRDRDRDHSSGSSITFASPNYAIPIKQDQPDYWSLLAYQKTPNVGSTFGSGFHSITPFSMEQQSSNNNGLLSDYMQQQQQQQQEHEQEQSSNASSCIPFATPITMNSYEGSSYGNWVAQSLHTFPSAKTNLSVFQTPIFGME